MLFRNSQFLHNRSDNVLKRKEKGFSLSMGILAIFKKCQISIKVLNFLFFYKTKSVFYEQAATFAKNPVSKSTIPSYEKASLRSHNPDPRDCFYRALAPSHGRPSHLGPCYRLANQNQSMLLSCIEKSLIRTRVLPTKKAPSFSR